jgi:hypothetical protein
MTNSCECRTLSSHEWKSIKRSVQALAALLEFNGIRLEESAQRMRQSRALASSQTSMPLASFIVPSRRGQQVPCAHFRLYSAPEDADDEPEDVITEICRDWYVDEEVDLVAQRVAFCRAMQEVKDGKVSLPVHCMLCIHAMGLMFLQCSTLVQLCVSCRCTL